MNEISNIFIRLRELSIQGASDTSAILNGASSTRKSNNSSPKSTASRTPPSLTAPSFSNGTAPNLEIQVGLNNNPQIDRFVYDSHKGLVTTIGSFGLGDVSTMTKENSQNNLAAIDAAIRT